DHNLLPFGLDIGQDVSLHVSGTATVEFEGLLTVTGAFTLDQQDVTAQDLVDQVGAGATALALTLHAQVLVDGVTVTGTLKLIQITNKTDLANPKSWLGVEASDISLTIALAPLSLAVTDGTLKLNQATGVGVSKLDWDSFTAATDVRTDPAVRHGLPFALDIDRTLDLHLSGNASIDLAGLLTIDGTFSLDKITLTGADAIVGSGAQALALHLTAAASASGVSASGDL